MTEHIYLRLPLKLFGNKEPILRVFCIKMKQLPYFLAGIYKARLPKLVVMCHMPCVGGEYETKTNHIFCTHFMGVRSKPRIRARPIHYHGHTPPILDG
jgi:hypothetical protein